MSSGEVAKLAFLGFGVDLPWRPQPLAWAATPSTARSDDLQSHDAFVDRAQLTPHLFDDFGQPGKCHKYAFGLWSPWVAARR